MDRTVSDYIKRLQQDKPDATTVYYRYAGLNCNQSIASFLEVFGSRICGLNAEIYFEDGTFNVNNFIRSIH